MTIAKIHNSCSFYVCNIVLFIIDVFMHIIVYLKFISRTQPSNHFPIEKIKSGPTFFSCLFHLNIHHKEDKTSQSLLRKDRNVLSE